MGRAKQNSEKVEKLHQEAEIRKMGYNNEQRKFFFRTDPEDKDEYTAERVFYVPPVARWKWLQGRVKLPSIGKDVDDAIDAIETDNASLYPISSVMCKLCAD